VRDNSAAHEFYSTARGFCQSATAMVTNEMRLKENFDISIFLGFHCLLGFAVEMYLKAFLVDRFVELRELKHSPYGHNIDTLLAKASAEGFACEAAKELCEIFDRHQTLEFRYIRSNSKFRNVNISVVLKLLSDLDHYVDDYLGVSAAYGFQPDKGEWSIRADLSEWRIDRPSNSRKRG